MHLFFQAKNVAVFPRIGKGWPFHGFSLSFRRVLLLDSESLDHDIDEFVSTNHRSIAIELIEFDRIGA